MRKNVSLESQICDIIANSTVESSFKGVEFKLSSTKTTKYEFCADFEEELKRRARSLSRKKVVKFPVPKVQKVLLVFSKHRGKVDEILERLDKCDGRYQLPLSEIGFTKDEISTLQYCRGKELSYALSIMPDAYK